jgi:hypothetical protein
MYSAETVRELYGVKHNEWWAVPVSSFDLFEGCNSVRFVKSGTNASIKYQL